MGHSFCGEFMRNRIIFSHYRWIFAWFKKKCRYINCNIFIYIFACFYQTMDVPKRQIRWSVVQRFFLHHTSWVVTIKEKIKGQKVIQNLRVIYKYFIAFQLVFSFQDMFWQEHYSSFRPNYDSFTDERPLLILIRTFLYACISLQY